jgi:hypothetical protein
MKKRCRVKELREGVEGRSWEADPLSPFHIGQGPFQWNAMVFLQSQSEGCLDYRFVYTLTMRMLLINRGDEWVPIWQTDCRSLIRAWVWRQLSAEQRPAKISVLCTYQFRHSIVYTGGYWLESERPEITRVQSPAHRGKTWPSQLCLCSNWIILFLQSPGRCVFIPARCSDTIFIMS